MNFVYTGLAHIKTCEETSAVIALPLYCMSIRTSALGKTKGFDLVGGFPAREVGLGIEAIAWLDMVLVATVTPKAGSREVASGSEDCKRVCVDWNGYGVEIL